MRFRSIRTSLTFLILAFFLIDVVLVTAAVTGLKIVNDNTQKLNQQWLVGNQILSKVSNEVADFRIAENYRALALEPGYETDAERLANEHRETITKLLDRYNALTGTKLATNEFGAFVNAWTLYLSDHKDWVTRDVDLNDDAPARSGSKLHEDYKAVEKTVHRLVAMNSLAADVEASEAERVAHRTIVFVCLSAALAGLLTLALLWQAYAQISKPLRTITAALSNLASGSLEVRVPQLHRRDEIGEMAAAFEVFRTNAVALTEARQLADSLARHDALTGLPNRRLFSSSLETALTEEAATYAVMLLDLDKFKVVNDLQGHATGDLVLCEVARRLTDVVKSGTVARLGGDEFAVIAPTLQDAKLRAEALMTLAGNILRVVGEPIISGDKQIAVGVSIGIAVYPMDGTDAEALLRAADLAMYRAKKEGRNAVRFFEQNMDEELRNRANLEADLRQALHDGDIKPFYQPLIDFVDGTIRGFEVLARWHHPVRGSIPPDTFIPVLEQLGLALDLTSCMLHQACRDAREWEGNVRLAINVSPAEFQNAILPNLVMAILDAERFPPSRLEIEVTETGLVGDIKAAKATLDALQGLGIKVVLDDFGTGYSSLYHLRELRFDKLKIDRSFVHSMQQDQMKEKIVNCMLQLANSLNMPAVAEGIEDEVTANLLIKKGCSFGQGFFYSKAVSAAEVGRMLVAATQDIPGYTAPSAVIRAA